jgi:hypothetical protein
MSTVITSLTSSGVLRLNVNTSDVGSQVPGFAVIRLSFENVGAISAFDVLMGALNESTPDKDQEDVRLSKLAT